MKYLSIILLTILFFVMSLFSVLFGSSGLNQIHSNYLRNKGLEVVKITNSQGSGGTGFIAKGKSGNNVLLTNGHVCNLAENNQLFADYRGDKYVLPVIKQYQYNDLCAVVAPTKSSSIGIAETSYKGQLIYILGHPLLEPLSLTSGELSGTVRLSIPISVNPAQGACQGPTYTIVDAPLMFQFFGIQKICVRTLESQASTASILPGNSGSPVLNNYGLVVGVAFAGSTEGVRSYIVPLNDVRDFLGEL